VPAQPVAVVLPEPVEQYSPAAAPLRARAAVARLRPAVRAAVPVRGEALRRPQLPALMQAATKPEIKKLLAAAR